MFARQAAAEEQVEERSEKQVMVGVIEFRKVMSFVLHTRERVE